MVKKSDMWEENEKIKSSEGSVFPAETGDSKALEPVRLFNLKPDRVRVLEKPEAILFTHEVDNVTLSKYVYEWAQWYVDTKEDKLLEFHKTRGDKSDTYERLVEVNLPTIEGLATYLGVTSETVKAWSRKDAEFKRICDHIKEIRKQRLIEKGLSGEYNAGFAKYLLSAMHGMREGVDVTSNGNSIESFGMGHAELARRQTEIIDVTPDNE